MPNINIINWAERRIKRRHKAPDLRVTIKAAGLKKWFRASVEVSCIDINRYGMAIETNKLFKAKDKVIIGFKGKYITQSNVFGVITESVKCDCPTKGEHYRISVVFSYALKGENYCRKTDNALSRIESLYSHKQESRAS